MTANVPVKFLFNRKVSNNIVSDNDSAKKVHSCLLLNSMTLIKNQKNSRDLDVINLFLLSMLLLAS